MLLWVGETMHGVEWMHMNSMMSMQVRIKEWFVDTNLGTNTSTKWKKLRWIRSNKTDVLFRYCMKVLIVSMTHSIYQVMRMLCTLLINFNSEGEFENGASDRWPMFSLDCIFNPIFELVLVFVN